MITRVAVTLFAMALLADTAAAAVNAAPDLVSRAAAITPDPEHGKILYLKHCAECHRSHAWGDGPREIPALAGQRQRYLIEQLARFASDERKGSVMHGSVMDETLQRPDLNRPQAISDLAAYLSRAARNPEPEHSEGRCLVAGRRIYAQACSACHGSAGEGNDGEAVPKIAGQHYSYLLTQLRGFVAGVRTHPPFPGFAGACPLRSRKRSPAMSPALPPRSQPTPSAAPAARVRNERPQ